MYGTADGCVVFVMHNTLLIMYGNADGCVVFVMHNTLLN
jgi:hypothetical protein